MSLLCLEHVSRLYPDGRGEIAALDDVSLAVEDGDFVGVWGPRRSGKSTLLRVAASAEPCDAGRVCFDGHDLTSMSAGERARLHRFEGIALVSTDWRPVYNKPVVEHVALPLLSDGLSLQEAKGPALVALERTGVSNCSYLPAERLSYVERVRVALARALVRRPRLLLVDEPTVPLGPSEGVELYDLLCSLGGEPGVAVVIASEDVAPLRRARRMFSIDRGRVRSTTPETGKVLPFPGQRGVSRAHS
jgi:predicted ABC-type transport system involved in lysophospholipase L1 biosynthesis ATPase subunit